MPSFGLKILSDKTKEIIYIYHLSDIHIRNTQNRESEYKYVFNKLYNKLKNDKDLTNSIIVITGDILHNKIELRPETVDTTAKFIWNLLEIMPVIIIPGNHDGSTSKNKLDALSPIIDLIKKKKRFLHYLTEEGFYSYNNLIFGVGNVFNNTSPPSANILNNTNKVKIALYHGQVNNAQISDSLKAINNKLDLEEFNGYDIVMLGDIHRHQFLDKHIAYVGSLIQQDITEDIRDHGYIRWNLKARTGKLIHVSNKYGFVNIQITNDIVYPEHMPTCPTITLHLTSKHNDDNIKQDIIKHFDIDPENITWRIEKELSQEIDKTDLSSNKLYDDLFLEYMANQELDEDIKKEIIKMHTKKETDEITISNKKWIPLKLKFSNLFSFGKDNMINFVNYNNIIGILAPNGYGKSSIIDIILFTIYGKCSRVSSMKDKNKHNIINDKKKYFDTELEVQIDNDIYVIKRTGKIKTKKGKKNLLNTVDFYKKTLNDKISIFGSKTEITNKINEYFGDYDIMTNTYFFLQNAIDGMINKSPSDRLLFIRKIFRLNKYNDEITKTKDDIRLCKDVIKKNKNKINEDEIIKQQKQVEENKKQITELDKIIQTKYAEKKLLNDERDNIAMFPYDDKLDIEDINNKHSIYIKKKKAYNATIPINIDVSNNDIDKIKTEIEQINNIQYNQDGCPRPRVTMNLGDKKSIKYKIDSYTKEIMQLEKKIIKITDIETSISEDKYKKYLKILNHKKDNLQRKKDITNELKSISTRLTEYADLQYNPECSACVHNNKQKIENKNMLLKERDILNKELQNLQDISIDKESKAITDYDNILKAKIQNDVHKINNAKLQQQIDKLKSDLTNEQHRYDSYDKLYNDIKEHEINYDKAFNLYYQKQNIEIKLKLKSELDTLSHIEDVYKKAKTNIENFNLNKQLSMRKFEITKQIDDIEKQITDCYTRKNRLNEKIITVSLIIDNTNNYRKEIYENEHSLKINNEYMKMLSNFPEIIIQTKILPHLTSEANNILSKISDKLRISTEIDNGLNIYITNKSSNRIINLEFGSGFEKFIIDIAFRISLSYYSKITKPNFIVIDEGFTSLDKHHLGSINKIFDFLRHKFKFIIIISHIDMLKEQVDKNIEIEKINGYSIIK